MDLFKLTNIEFHDLPVEAININTSEQTIDLIISIYDDAKDDYDVKNIRFNNVANFALRGEMLLDKSTGIADITDDNLTEITDGYSVEIIFNQGSGEPTFEITFEFSGIVVTDVP